MKFMLDNYFSFLFPIYRPLPDYSFEQLLVKNLSFHQYIFMLDGSAGYIPQVLTSLPNTTTYKAEVVPNDPADFGRNSYHMMTINSILNTLSHRHVDVLKVRC